MSQTSDQDRNEYWENALRNGRSVSGVQIAVHNLLEDLDHVVDEMFEECHGTEGCIDYMKTFAAKILTHLNPEFQLYISQLDGLLWCGLRRFIVEREGDSYFPGGLIFDEQGTGKTIKALLIAAGFAMDRSPDVSTPVIILVKPEVVEEWQAQADNLFKDEWLNNIYFLNMGDKIHKIDNTIARYRIAVLPFSSGKELTKEYPCLIVDEAHEYVASKRSINAKYIFAMTATPKVHPKRKMDDGGSSVGVGGVPDVNDPLRSYIPYDKARHCCTLEMCLKIIGWKKKMSNEHLADDTHFITLVKSVKLPGLRLIKIPVVLDDVCKVLHEAIEDVRATSTSVSALNKVASSLYFMPWLILKSPRRSTGGDMFVRSETHDFVFLRDKAPCGSTMESIKKQFEKRTSSTLFGVVEKQDRDDTFVVVGERKVYIGPYIKALLNTIDTALRKHDKIIVYTDFIHEGDCISYLLTQTKPDLKFANAREMADEAVETFKTDDQCRVIIMCKSHHGTGLNMQCASAVIMTAIEQNGKRDQQLVGRVHRPGQTKQVAWFHLTGSSPLEMERLEKKQKNSDGCSEFFYKKAPKSMAVSW